MSSDTTVKAPKPFTGSTRIQFEIHYVDVENYANSKGLADVLRPEWRIGQQPAAPELVPVPPEPGYPAPDEPDQYHV